MIGPALPPHLADKEENSQQHADEVGTSSAAVVGPSVPPNLMKRAHDDEAESPECKKTKPGGSPAEAIGPVIPAELLKNQPEEEEEDVVAPIGPSLPPEIAENLQQRIEAAQEEAEEDFGPALPPSMRPEEESDSDEEEFGPQLPGANEDESYEIRFINYRIREDEKKKKETKREEWMLKCPEKKGGQGLSYLNFSRDTDKASSSVQPKGGDSGEPEALVDQHQRKIQKEREAAKDEQQERKPFNRDEDMSMMSGGKKVDLNKLREHMGSLGSRFSSSGSSSKFL